METLFERYRTLNLALNQHICRLLDIPNSLLDDYFPSKTEFNAAMWHYFPITPEQREAKSGFVQGMHEHRDPSTFVTCLIQSRAGLQAQNHQGEWVDIPMVEGGVVCNIGVSSKCHSVPDTFLKSIIGVQLMRLTGGRMVATLHRVNTLKIEEDRFVSYMYFWMFPPDVAIGIPFHTSCLRNLRNLSCLFRSSTIPN